MEASRHPEAIQPGIRMSKKPSILLHKKQYSFSVGAQLAVPFIIQ